MKVKIILFIIIALVVFGVANSYAETIYTKDGRTISAKITTKVKNTIWYEVQLGRGTGRIGINLDIVSKILNDDGTISPYSPTQSVASAKPKKEIATGWEDDFEGFEEFTEERHFDKPSQPTWAEEASGIEEAARPIPYAEQEPEKAKAGEAAAPSFSTTEEVIQIQGPGLEGFGTTGTGQIDVGKFLPQLMALSFGFIAFILILALAFYAYFSICLQMIAKKTDTSNAWLAWIPIANLFLMLSISKRPQSWRFILGGLVLLSFIPFVSIIGGLGVAVLSIILWCDAAKARNKPFWLGILMAVPFAQIIIPGYLAFSK